jgi:hypothetical protein
MTTTTTTRRRVSTLAIAAIALLAGGASAGAQQQKTSPGEVARPRVTGAALKSLIAAWPAKQQETANTMISKYGDPAIASDRMLVWYDTGPFVKTAVMRDEVQHNFPMPHVDYLTQTVKHTVPADKLAALYEYDGSVWFHRTRGELSAQCDVEAMNMLALNLAHDIITGKRTASDARAFYAQTAKAYKAGDKSSEYVTGLIFKPEPNAADPDRANEKP